MLRIILLAIILLSPTLPAHQIEEMGMRIEAVDGRFRAVVMADAAYMLPEFRGDQDVAAQDLAWLRSQDTESWERIQRETELYLRACLSIENGGQPVEWRIAFPDFSVEPPAFMQNGIPEALPMLKVALEGSFENGDLEISWNEAFGVNLIVQAEGETIPIVNGYREPVLRMTLDDGAQAIVPSLAGWIMLGFRHIVPSGLDHILFILGIFLLQPKWKPLLGQSLTFTFAHSLTLGLAVMGWVRLPEAPVEIAIGASIAWIGIENLRAKEPGTGRYFLIAAFGLIHGLGFASMLTPYLPDGQPQAILYGLTGFNLGVELGQILVLLLAFAIVGWWPESKFAKLKLVGSTLIVLSGVTFVIGRLLA